MMMMMATKMITTLLTFQLLLLPVLCTPYHYPSYDPFLNYDLPYYNPFRTYLPQLPVNRFVPTYTNDLIEDRVTASYLNTPDVLPTLNVLAEVPYAVNKKFTVVPMFLMAKENMRMVTDVDIMNVSKERPVMTVKTGDNDLLRCTPAVRIVLEKPVVVYSLKTDVLFPSEIQIAHRGYKIPILVGAVVAPIRHDTFVSVDSPVAIRVVYAIPTTPISIDYINNEDAVFVPDNEAVVVESHGVAPDLPPKNITVLSFPENEAEPTLQVNEEDEELVNRRPPQFLAPGGIVSSDQPSVEVRPFVNSKESAVLVALREELKKKRV